MLVKWWCKVLIKNWVLINKWEIVKTILLYSRPVYKVHKMGLKVQINRHLMVNSICLSLPQEAIWVQNKDNSLVRIHHHSSRTKIRVLKSYNLTSSIRDLILQITEDHRTDKCKTDNQAHKTRLEVKVRTNPKLSSKQDLTRKLHNFLKTTAVFQIMLSI